MHRGTEIERENQIVKTDREESKLVGKAHGEETK
jgi:hypothetical protein